MVCTLGKMVYVVSGHQNCTCLSAGIRCQPRWMDSWLDGLPLRFSLKDLKEQLEILLSIIDLSREPLLSRPRSPENEQVLLKMMIVVAGSIKRLAHDEVVDRIKEVLIKFSLAQENAPLLAKVVGHLDEESKSKLSFLHVK